VTQTINEQDVYVEMERALRKLVPDFEGEIKLSSTFDEIDIDSLTRVDLLAAMESAFGIEVPDDEVMKIVRVQDLATLVLTLRSAA
jgi:acyl carrier protein